MLAAGMLTDLAAATALRSRGFASRSPPPCRAASVISLMYLENSLPRAWSVAAFLRLIVAHLEWPDMELEGVRRAPPPPSRHARRRSHARPARAAPRRNGTSGPSACPGPARSSADG